jgi:quinol monooxygenase YgiN
MYFFLAAALLSVSQAQDQSMEDVILGVTKKNFSDSGKPFALVIQFKIKEGQGPKFEAAMAKAVKETRKDKGNQAYELSKTPKGSTYVIYERWENVAALEAHLKTAHYKEAAAAVKPLLDMNISVELLVPVPVSN